MRRALFAVASLAVLFAPVTAEARLRAGVRVGEYTDVETDHHDHRIFAGAEISAWLGNGFVFNPNFEWVFLDRGDLFTVNGDLQYQMPIARKAFVWVGGGPTLVHVDQKGFSATDFTGNLQLGLGFRAGRTIPYLEVKYLFPTDDTDGTGVVAFGMRF